MPTPNVIKYSASPVSNTIGRNNMRLGISDNAGYGPTSSTDFWNGYTPGASGYTIYVNKVSNGPSIFSPANDTELINTAKYIATSINLSPTITTAVEAISWINSQSNMICVNYNYPSIVTSGLVALLDASFTTSYSKGGTGWRDLSDTQSTATLINGVSYLTNNNGSLSYSSSSLQYAELPDLGNLSNFTVSCWFKLSTLPTTSGAAAVVANVYNGSNLNFSVGLNNSPFSSNICGGFFNGAWRTTSGFTPATGSWYSVDVTYNGSQIIQYLNGAEQSTLTYSGTAQSSGLGIRIGRRWDSSPSSVDFINGEIPFVSIYNRALSSSEILSNYNSIKSRYQSGIVISGLLIELDAYSSTSYPGSGTTVVNSQTPGTYDHTLTSATYTVLNGIKCFDCTTGTKRIVVNGTGPTLPTTGYTYITWARLEVGNPAGFRTLLYTNSPKYTPITIPNGTNTLGYWDTAFRSSGYDLASSVGVWVQYAVVGDNSSQSFYINGSQVGSTIAYGAGGTTHWGWGNNDIVPQAWGYVANMYFYNRKLTLAEIQQQYDYLSPRFIEEPVTENLVLYYDPSNSSSYSGSGTTINDLSGNGLSGTLSNVTYTSPAFNFNGTSSTISVPDNSLLEPGSGDWTMEAWVNHSVTTGSSRIILGKTDGGLANQWGYGLRTIANGNTYGEVGNGTTSIASNSSALSINTWYQVVGVWTNVASNNFELFINGVSQGSQSHSFTSIRNTTNPLYIGSFNNGQFSQWLNGKIGIVRLYNSALTSSQVLQNYNVNKSKYGL